MISTFCKGVLQGGERSTRESNHTNARSKALPSSVSLLSDVFLLSGVSLLSGKSLLSRYLRFWSTTHAALATMFSYPKAAKNNLQRYFPFPLLEFLG